MASGMPGKTTRAILADLVAFDTTTVRSNLPLVGYVRDYLASLGVEAEIFPDPTGTKANLWATIGPPGPGGTILSGHTDCVPVEGETWTSDPFVLTEREGRLYGRGACDMKGFLASCLAAVPGLAAARLARPVHLAFSYDEEIGCSGVGAMIERLAARGERPARCIVGEPTEMRTVVGHKGGRAYRCEITGLGAHSSLAPLAVNAIDYAAQLVLFLRGLAAEFAQGPRDGDYDVAHSTVSTGIIEGGTAVNIVPSACAVTFEFRHLAEVDPAAIFARIKAYAEDVLLPDMRRLASAADIVFKPLYTYPAHAIDPADPLVTEVKHAVGENGHSKVAFGTEAGLFAAGLDVPTVICGPGSITVAHKPDEYVTLEQLDRCDAALRRLLKLQ